MYLVFLFQGLTRQIDNERGNGWTGLLQKLTFKILRP